MKHSFQILLGSTLLLSLAGCTTPYRTPEISGIGGNPHFLGIVDSFEADKPLDVLLVHGMCTHNENWANDAVKGLYHALGGGPTKVELKKTGVIGSDIELYQQTLSTTRGSLRMNALVWSPLTTPLKKQLCFDQTDRSDYCRPDDVPEPYRYQRAKLNQVLKDTILNDCLSDAMIYQGVSRQTISRQVQLAIVQALGTSGGASTPASSTIMTKQLEMTNAQAVPLILVSESLGSKVTFDALLALTQHTNQDVRLASQQAFDRVSQIFMEANQLPILAMADQNIDEGKVGVMSSRPMSSLGKLLKDRAHRADLKPIENKAVPEGQVIPPLPTVVAFTDPNDLLSYSLAGSQHRQREGYPLVDVIVSNAPTILGFVEMPNAAHSGYRENDMVKKLIACGHPSSNKCR